MPWYKNRRAGAFLSPCLSLDAETMVDYQTKYESLLRNVLTDLNTDVLTAQARAEKNAEGEKACVRKCEPDIRAQLTNFSLCLCLSLSTRARVCARQSARPTVRH